ncbi:MAG: carbohydrate-binding family 9-like protein [Myxococcota bacterium]|nr:carbohydrate-binding family 9-like protein [Myxococcota bacterium]
MERLPALHVPRVAHKIPVGAELVKPPWHAIAPVSLVPSHGGAPAAGFRATALRVAHDGERLHLVFHCEGGDPIATQRGRNLPIYETDDVVEAFLAPSGDPRRYFELESSAADAWFEARVENPDGHRATLRVDREWSCAGWQRAVRIEPARWSVAWAIPFASLETDAPAPGTRWRANFYRIDRHAGGHFSAWSPTFATPPDFHLPHRFGVLVF